MLLCKSRWGCWLQRRHTAGGGTAWSVVSPTMVCTSATRTSPSGKQGAHYEWRLKEDERGFQYAQQNFTSNQHCLDIQECLQWIVEKWMADNNGFSLYLLALCWNYSSILTIMECNMYSKENKLEDFVNPSNNLLGDRDCLTIFYELFVLCQTETIYFLLFGYTKLFLWNNLNHIVLPFCLEASILYFQFSKVFQQKQRWCGVVY